MIRILSLLALLLLAFNTAGAGPREVEVTATGLTSRDAITQGLVQALEHGQRRCHRLQPIRAGRACIAGA